MFFILKMVSYYYMKADLHIHTTYSDGVSTPEEIVDSAIEKGIKCICITDHDETKGALKAIKYAYDKDILVLPGIELLSSSGDILGINIKKVIPSYLSAKETIKEIKKQGGIAVIPHPFNKPINSFWGGEEILNFIKPDAIEAFNASVFFSSSNRKAFNFSKKNNFSFTAGSDAHRKEFIGRGYIEISDKISNEKDLISAIMQREAKPKGKVLSYLECFKNAKHTNISDIIEYYFYKRKNGKKALL